MGGTCGWVHGVKSWIYGGCGQTNGNSRSDVVTDANADDGGSFHAWKGAISSWVSTSWLGYLWRLSWASYRKRTKRRTWWTRRAWRASESFKHTCAIGSKLGCRIGCLHEGK